MSENNKRYISSLYSHIDETFRLSNSKMADIIEGFIANGTLKGLQFDDTVFPMKGPNTVLKTGIIYLQDGFLSYLWTVCYFMIGLTEIYQDMAATGKPIVNLMESEKFQILNNTFAWGRSLKMGLADEFGEWPDHIANPLDETVRSNQANHLLVLAATYLMFHEMGHLVQHRDAAEYINRVKSPYYDQTDEDRRRLRMMEIQADNYAVDAMFKSITDEHDRYLRFLATIIAHLSEFFLRHIPNTKAINYPDLDERLKRVIKKIDVQHPGYKMHLDLTLTIGLQTFFALTFAEYIPSEMKDFAFEDFDELSDYLFRLIDAWKEK